MAESGDLYPEPDLVRHRLGQIDWDFSGYVPTASATGIHGLHWYPAPFPPALAGTLIDILSPCGGTFADPFAGSGVAPIEAWLRGHRAFGIDNNDFAVDLSRAKTKLLAIGTGADGRDLADAFERWRTARLQGLRAPAAEEICAESGISPDATRWFVVEVLRDLAAIRAWLVDRTDGPGEWANVCRIIASSLLHGHLSKVRNYHYTYVVDRSRVKTEALDPVDAATLFVERLRTQFAGAEFARIRLSRGGMQPDPVAAPVFVQGSSSDISVITGGVDLVVTSPPYFGMNDYVRSQYLTQLVFPWAGYDSQVRTESGSRRSRWSRKALDAYVDEMTATFRMIRTRLNAGGYLAVIIGNSTTSLARESDPTQIVYEHIIDSGFDAVWRGERRIRFRKINNTPLRSEAVWVFRR